MKIYILLITICSIVFGENNDRLSTLRRRKREAGGALDIVTNNAQPIHAEVKLENAEVKLENAEVTEKQCFKTRRTDDVPSQIEPGVVFQVTPPKAVMYESKSLRKSLPLTSRLDLIRGVSRIVTLSVLAISAVFEFYPVVRQTYDTIIDMIYST